MRPHLAGFIEPCLPSPAPNPPAGDGWIHEIKLDGFRMLARRDGAGVRLLTRRGIDWTTPLSIHCRRRRGSRLPLLPDRWRSRNLRRGWHPGIRPAALWAPTSDRGRTVRLRLVELGGKDLRRAPLEERKGALAKLVRKASWAVQFEMNTSSSDKPDGSCSYFNPRRHPQPSAQLSRRRLSRIACSACSGIAMSA
jgi:hypothetical protein